MLLYLLFLLINSGFCLFKFRNDSKYLENFAKDYEKLKNVSTPYGFIAGHPYMFNKTNKGVEYLGIPFAKAPIGNLRFKEPQPLEKPAWNGTFYANKTANSCPADIYPTNFTGYSFWNPTNNISEDCLQLNMWVPTKRDPKGACVLVYIYGGAFFSGSASLDVYNGSILSIKSYCIVIDINYRLGALGFSYLNDSVIPGNMGLLDQQLALQWIHENIHLFGGDNKTITLFGESAGAFSVVSHLYSNKSHEYFSRVISNSGTVNNVWGKNSPEYAHNKTIRLAKKLKCVNATTKNNNTAILECLQRANVSDIVSIGAGRAADEFTYFMPFYFYDEKYNCSYNESIPNYEDANKCNISEAGYENIIKRVSKEMKFPDDLKNNLSTIYEDAYKWRTYQYRSSRFLSEVYFDCDIFDWVKKIASYVIGPIYYYEFKAVSSANPWPKWMGAMHGYELEYEFGLPIRNESLYNPRRIEKEKNLSLYFMGALGGFARIGVPNIYWKPFNASKPIAC
uniref:Carboxylic ester hydrolase n=1 Tax=Parastrongyloides trichosuri TaxID=131310 RepID=A0A0N4Z3E3_PARTI